MRGAWVQVLAVAAALFLSVDATAQVAPLPTSPIERRLEPPRIKPADSARVEAAVAQLGLPCPVSRARMIATPRDPQSDFAEVACGAGRMGYVLQLRKGRAPEAFTCLEANTGTGDKPATRPCLLTTAAEAQVMLGQAMGDPTCDVAGARGIGHTATTGYFELACKDDRSFILEAASPFDPAKPVKAQPCVLYDQGSSNITCELGDPAARLRVVDKLASNVGCTVTERRFAGVSKVDGRYYFEAACADGRVTFVSGTLEGVFGEALGCDVAAPRFGACRFAAPYKAQAAAHTGQAKAAGDACEVAAFEAFAPKPDGQWTEFACRDGSGRVARIASGGQLDLVVDCGLAPIVGYKCTLSHAKKAAAAVTTELYRVSPGTSCPGVSDTRLMGVTSAGTVYMEVSCIDGYGGYVIEFERAPKPKALRAVNCALVGQCKLLGNTLR